MIKYKLKCLECSKEFDSWFNSSVEYEKLKKKNFLICYLCGSQNIDKTIMSPNISNSINKANNSKIILLIKLDLYIMMLKMIKKEYLELLH